MVLAHRGQGDGGGTRADVACGLHSQDSSASKRKDGLERWDALVPTQGALAVEEGNEGPRANQGHVLSCPWQMQQTPKEQERVLGQRCERGGGSQGTGVRRWLSVAQQVSCPLSERCSSPGWSTSNPDSCYCTWEGSRGRPKALGPLLPWLLWSQGHLGREPVDG